MKSTVLSSYAFKLLGAMQSALICATMILISTLFSSTVSAQLESTDKLYPGVRMIRIKHFNGSGSGRYSLRRFLDEQGRVITEKSFRGRKLMLETTTRYDDKGNPLAERFVYDINHQRTNSPVEESTYEYTYDVNGRILKEVCTLGNYAYIRQIERQIDSVTFDLMFIVVRNTSDPQRDSHLYTIVLDDFGRIAKRFEPQFDTTGTETTVYHYDALGNLSRRQVIRENDTGFPTVYVGAPASDDDFYFYKLGKKKRIKKEFIISKGKTYKRAVYSYEEF